MNKISPAAGPLTLNFSYVAEGGIFIYLEDYWMAIDRLDSAVRLRDGHTVTLGATTKVTPVTADTALTFIANHGELP